MEQFFSGNSSLYAWVILPAFIFLARIIDVSLGTIRIVSVARGYRSQAAITGFFEVFIWIVVIGQIFVNINNYLCYFAYAAGFAMGNYLGIALEEKLAIGIMSVRIITHKDATELAQSLRDTGYGVTKIDAEGMTGHVNVIFTFVKRLDLKKVVEKIQTFNPRAFYTVEHIHAVREGTFPLPSPGAFSRLAVIPRFQKRK